MKELKFRAFNKHTGELLDVQNISFVFQQVEVCVTRNGRDYYPIWEFKDIELMQYTGYKDKKGNEIYEGDILQDSTDKAFGVVNFENGWVYNYKNKTIFLHATYSKVQKIPVTDFLEVKGNIYQNPELLEALDESW